MLSLQPVGCSVSAIAFLYDLLDDAPTFEEHRKFVESRPYKFWYLIVDNGMPVGSIALPKTGEVKVSLKDGVSIELSDAALKLLMDKHPMEFAC